MSRTPNTLRELDFARRLEALPGRTREMLLSGHKDYGRIYEAWRGAFLRGEFDFLSLFVDRGKAAVDVGANMGMYALTLSGLAERCVSIEPVEVYRFIGDLLPENCQWKTVAAGEVVGRARLRIPAAENGTVHYGLSTLAAGNPLAGYQCREQETEVLPLDELIGESLGDEAVGFIKIDTEGFEPEVLRGARATLERWRPNLQVEIDPGRVGEVMRFLEGLGYRGMFFFGRQLLDATRFRPEMHCAAANQWSPQTHASFDPDLYVSNFFFVPASGLS